MSGSCFTDQKTLQVHAGRKHCPLVMAAAYGVLPTCRALLQAFSLPSFIFPFPQCCWCYRFPFSRGGNGSTEGCPRDSPRLEEAIPRPNVLGEVTLADRPSEVAVIYV